MRNLLPFGIATLLAAALPAFGAPRQAKPPAAPASPDGMEIEHLPAEGGISRAQITTEHYRIYLEKYDPGDTGRMMEAAYKAWSAFFGKEPLKPTAPTPGKEAKPPRKLVVKGYATPQNYQAGGKKDGTPAPTGAANMGMYWTGTSIAHFYAPSGKDALRYMILHEAAHQYHYIAMTGNGGATANWYIEGLAIWSGSSAWDGKVFTLGGGVKPGPLKAPARTLAQITSDHAAAVAFLVTRYPLEFRRLAAGLDQRKDERESWKEAFGFDEAPAEFADEYAAWRKSAAAGSFSSWEPLVKGRAPAASVNTALWRLGKAAPASLVKLRSSMAEAEAAGKDPNAVFAGGLWGVLQDLKALPPEASVPVRYAASGFSEASAHLKLKVSPGGLGLAVERPSRPAPKPAGPGAVKEYDDRLRKRIQELLAGGKTVRFDFAPVGGPVRVDSLEAGGAMKLGMDAGGAVNLTWAELFPRDRLMLALSLVEKEPEARGEDHALAAFFLLLENRAERAERHLLKAGRLGEAVRNSFSMGSRP
jgi:hypothetical protein